MITKCFLICTCTSVMLSLTGCDDLQVATTPDYTLPDVEAQMVGNEDGGPHEAVLQTYELSEDFVREYLGDVDFEGQKAQIEHNIAVVGEQMAATQGEINLWKGIMSSKGLLLNDTDSQYKKFLKLNEAAAAWATEQRLSMPLLFDQCGLTEEEADAFLNQLAGIPDDSILPLPEYEEINNTIIVNKESMTQYWNEKIGLPEDLEENENDPISEETIRQSLYETSGIDLTAEMDDADESKEDDGQTEE